TPAPITTASTCSVTAESARSRLIGVPVGDLVIDGEIEQPLPLGHHGGHHAVTGDVDGGADHVQQAVDTDDQGDALHRQAHLLEHHGEGDKPHPRHPGGTHRGEGGGGDHRQVAADADVDVEGLGDEHRRHTLHDGGAVHVD